MASEMDGLTNIVVGDTIGAVIIAAQVGVVGDAAIAVEPAATPSGIKPKPSPKTGRKRSEAWDHFPHLICMKITKTTTCKYCPQTNLCGSKGYGTSNMLGHCRICKHNPDIDHASNQTKLAYTLSAHGSDGNLQPWKFDQTVCREWLGKMLVIDELPFRFVDRKGSKSLRPIAAPNLEFILESQ